MRVFLIGDYRTGSGPANVTLAYKEQNPGWYVQRMRGKISRVPELLVKIMACDVILLSGYSKQNLLSLKLAKLFRKKSAYLMHGCVEHENAINGVPDAEMNRVERATLLGSDLILAVSERFSVWLALHYPQIADKIVSMPNGIDLLPVTEDADVSRIAHRIMSIGGGMPRKKIKYIARAIETLREDPIYADTELIVIGAPGLDSPEVDAYPFVKNLGTVSGEKTGELLRSCALYVQNSCFETFGLAPLEALSNGASLLLSEKVGAIEVFSDPEENDLIQNVEDTGEIARKIKMLLQCGNASRLRGGIDTESVSWEKRSKELVLKLERLCGEQA